MLLVNKSDILIIGSNISAEKSLNDIVKWGLFKVFSKLILCSLSHNTDKMYHLSPVVLLTVHCQPLEMLALSLDSCCVYIGCQSKLSVGCPQCKVRAQFTIGVLAVLDVALMLQCNHSHVNFVSHWISNPVSVRLFIEDSRVEPKSIDLCKDSRGSQAAPSGGLRYYQEVWCSKWLSWLDPSKEWTVIYRYISDIRSIWSSAAFWLLLLFFKVL